QTCALPIYVEVVVPHREAAVADMRAAARLPVVVPELAAVARIHRPGVVGSGEIQDAVNLENRALDVGCGAGGEFAGALAARDNRRRRSSAASEGARGRARAPRAGRHLR